MSNLIKVDFANRKRVSEGSSDGFPSTIELREISGYTRTELLERSAIIVARMAIALLQNDELERQDLNASWEGHSSAISPRMTQDELALINRQAVQIIDQIKEE